LDGGVTVKPESKLTQLPLVGGAMVGPLRRTQKACPLQRMNAPVIKTIFEIQRIRLSLVKKYFIINAFLILMFLFFNYGF